MWWAMLFDTLLIWYLLVISVRWTVTTISLAIFTLSSFLCKHFYMYFPKRPYSCRFMFSLQSCKMIDKSVFSPDNFWFLRCPFLYLQMCLYFIFLLMILRCWSYMYLYSINSLQWWLELKYISLLVLYFVIHIHTILFLLFFHQENINK